MIRSDGTVVLGSTGSLIEVPAHGLAIINLSEFEEPDYYGQVVVISGKPTFAFGF